MTTRPAFTPKLAMTSRDQWAILVRISRDTDDIGEGVRRQEKDLREALHSLDVPDERITVYRENDTSAWARRRVKEVGPDGTEVTRYRVIRPVWEQLLQDLRDGKVTRALVYDLDRMCRTNSQLDDAIEVVKHFGREILGWRGDMDLMTPSGQAMAHVMVTFAGKSSGDTSRRVTDWHRHRAADGGTPGGPRPFGWNEDRITLNPAEAPHVRRWIDMLLAECSWGEIFADAKNHDLRGTRGRPLITASIRQIVLAPRCAGLRARGADVLRNEEGGPIIGQWDAICTIEEYERLVAMRGRIRQGVGNGKPKAYLLSGLVYCGKCGAKCRIGRRVAKRTREVSRCYACPPPSHSGCLGVSRDLDKVEGAVLDAVRARLSAAADDSLAQHGTDAAAPLAAQLNTLTQRRSKLLSDVALGEGSITFEILNTEMLPALDANIAELRRQLQDVSAPTTRKIAAATFSEEDWKRLGLPSQQRQISSLVDRVILHSPKRGRSFDYDSIEIVWV